MQITVTRKHIAYGRAMDLYDCPIALAIYDAFGGEKSVLVGTEEAFLSGERVKLPKVATDFIQGFDFLCHHRPLRWFLRSFTFDLPD